MVLVPAGGVTFLSLNKKVTKEVSLERRLLIAPAMKAALSKNFPGALSRTSGLPGHIPKGAEYYKNVSLSNKMQTEGFCRRDRGAPHSESKMAMIAGGNHTLIQCPRRSALPLPRIIS